MSDEIIAAAALFSLIQRNPFFINSGGDYTPGAKFLLHVTLLRQCLYPGDGLSPPCSNSVFMFLCSPGDKGRASFFFFPKQKKKLRKPDVFPPKTGHLKCERGQQVGTVPHQLGEIRSGGALYAEGGLHKSKKRGKKRGVKPPGESTRNVHKEKMQNARGFV